MNRYVDDPTVVTPSVITLNAVAAAHAVDDYMLSVTGVLPPDYEPCWRRFHPAAPGAVNRVVAELPRDDARAAPNAEHTADSAPARAGPAYKTVNVAVGSQTIQGSWRCHDSTVPTQPSAAGHYDAIAEDGHRHRSPGARSLSDCSYRRQKD